MNDVWLDLGHFWLAHAPIFSILIPMFSAVVLIFLGNPSADSLATDQRVPFVRGISLFSAILGVLCALSYLLIAQSGHITVYALSEWNAPFGIVLVLDRLSALMVLLSSSLGLVTVLYASRFWDLQGRYFHTMLHFLLMGLHGAFLTGDLFNLFVFFEILLISSYVLLIHGQGKARFQTAIQYVSINLLASAVFLIGLGLIYGNVGSLNMADVARLLPTLHGTPLLLASAGGLLLCVVFAIKAAMLPVGFWLPKTYAVASSPVALIFVIMSKVGIYAMLRVNGLVFQNSPAFATWQNGVLLLALLGAVYGVLAALATQRLKRFVGFMLLSSVSTLLLGVVQMSTQALAAMLYYLLHSTLVFAAFYLLCEWIYQQRGAAKDHLRVTDKMPSERRIACCFLILAWMMIGLPPFSGFMGKLMLLQASMQHPQQGWIITVVLMLSLLSLVAFCRVGFILFWKAREPVPHDDTSPRFNSIIAVSSPHHRSPAFVYGLCGSLLLLLVFTPQVYRYCLATAQQLMDAAAYQAAVLKRDAQGQVISVQPFDPKYVPQSKYGAQHQDANAVLLPHILSFETLHGENYAQHVAAQNALNPLPSQSLNESPKHPPNAAPASSNLQEAAP